MPKKTKVIWEMSSDRKTIMIWGPFGMALSVDFDDVDHDEVEAEVKKLCALLEKHW